MPDVKYDSIQINFVMPHLSSVQSAVLISSFRTLSDDSHKNYYKRQNWPQKNVFPHPTLWKHKS